MPSDTRGSRRASLTATLGVVGGTNDPLHYQMILLIDDLKLSRPEGSKYINSGLSGLQIRGGLKPNRRLVILLSYDVVVVRLHGRDALGHQRAFLAVTGGFSNCSTNPDVS